VFFGGEYNIAATLRTVATTAGLVAPMLGGDGMNDPAFITGAGPAAAGSFASGVGIPLSRLPSSASFLGAYQAAGYTSKPSDYGPYAYDAANVVIDTLVKELRRARSLPSGVRAAVVRDLQHADRTGLTGHIAFDGFGDIRDPQFTLYRVDRSAAAWVPVT
jgi:branched-chain amino acid transport system substrate-binding protein